MPAGDGDEDAGWGGRWNVRGNGAARGVSGCFAHTLRAMHGMLSAAILIFVFVMAAAACLYVAVRVYLAGTRRGPDAGSGPDGGPAESAGPGQGGQ
jgi:hypothetical protein